MDDMGIETLNLESHNGNHMCLGRNISLFKNVNE